MKHQFILCALLTITCAHATTIIADLNVGPPTASSNKNQITGIYSGAVGTENFVSIYNSFAIGKSNTLELDEYENYSLAVGEFNYLKTRGAIVGGLGNQVFCDYSFTTGYFNVNSANNSLVLGQNNITGYNLHRNGVVMGSYNAPVSKAAHLVIGNGTLYTPRKNSFIVYADGDIVITKPQGDISMGIYE
jgi:hypothetical protein